MEIIAIIPARGGSQSIPDKNLIGIENKPLIIHTIEQAKAVKEINSVHVSSDSDDILYIAQNAGANPIKRPAKLSTNEVKSEPALIHVLDELLKYNTEDPDLIVFLQCTSPLRRPHDIPNALAHFKKMDADSLFSCQAFNGFLWQAEPFKQITYEGRPRRQDMAQRYYIENGSIYITKPKILRKYNSVLGEKVSKYIMHELDSFEIDEQDDIETIKIIVRGRK